MRSRISNRYVPRRPSRHTVRLSCQVVRERDFKLVADEMIEISDGGLLVVPQSRILTGETVLLSFMAPFTRRFIDAEAVVARVLHGRRLGDAGPSVGLCITEMDEADEALIRSQLAYLPAAPPRRRYVS
ncbi:MAG: PilZ domain-containing protein [Polyangiaceae bacterium]|nr:PilZ domain-containing protein [Polyangiaceae bacterium]